MFINVGSNPAKINVYRKISKNKRFIIYCNGIKTKVGYIVVKAVSLLSGLGVHLLVKLHLTGYIFMIVS